MFLPISIFIVSCLILFFASSKLVGALSEIAEYLRWREFVVAFFIMAFACSLPNLFVGLSSAINGVPQLSFGDIVGGNVINLTLVVALAVLFSRGGLAVESKMVQSSAIFSTLVAVLPIILILDSNLDRIDGVILILTFIFYIFWLFSKEERFRKIYDDKIEEKGVVKKHLGFLKNFGKTVLCLALLLLAAQGIVKSSVSFSILLNFPLPLIGILIVSLGDTMPELYFSVISAKRNQNWMILGDLIGSVIYTSTLVLGIVALIYPIQITDFSPFLAARLFLVISALFFLLFLRTGKKITRTEGLALLGLYIAFLLAEVFIK